MACEGCNDGCFDESVQLQMGPAGSDGADGSDGSDGTDGVDGIAVLYQSTAINSPSTISNVYTDAISNISIPLNTLETVGDTLRIELLVQGDTTNDNATVAASTTYSLQVLFNADEVFEGIIGSANFGAMNGGSYIVLDLIVVATNTLTMKLVDKQSVFGSRADQFAYKMSFGNFVSTIQLPPIDSTGSTIGDITPTLSTASTIDIKLKNSDNASTSVASVTSATIYKYLKS